jgi:hypothetical protein
MSDSDPVISKQKRRERRLKLVDVDLALTQSITNNDYRPSPPSSHRLYLAYSLTPSSTLLAKRPLQPGITRPAITLALTQQRPRDQLCTIDPYHHHHRRFRSTSYPISYRRPIKAERFEHYNSQS